MDPTTPRPELLEPNGTGSVPPICRGLVQYRVEPRSSLARRHRDRGVTLVAVAIPEVMGYTSIAQVPAVAGLYAVMFPTLFTLLGSSRLLVVGGRRRPTTSSMPGSGPTS